MDRTLSVIVGQIWSLESRLWDACGRVGVLTDGTGHCSGYSITYPDDFGGPGISAPVPTRYIVPGTSGQLDLAAVEKDYGSLRPVTDRDLVYTERARYRDGLPDQDDSTILARVLHPAHQQYRAYPCPRVCG